MTEQARLVSAEGTNSRSCWHSALVPVKATGMLAASRPRAGDAVRLYQNEVGGIVLDSLLGSARS